MGIPKNMLKITDGALRQIIDEYTMESGVRDLKKCIETICRSAAVELVKRNLPQTMRRLLKKVLSPLQRVI